MAEIAPGVGLEGVSFGEDRETLRQRLGEHVTFQRRAGDPPIDHFLAEGLQLSFDQEDRLVFIEGTDQADLHYQGVRLTGQPLESIIEELAQRGVTVRVDDSGAELEGLNVYLYSPAPDELDVEVEAVAIRGSLPAAPVRRAAPGTDHGDDVATLF
ncbi:hypothetical protein [Actinoplanes sp. NPDC020271]|uniref:hypothetical protein n=1 Tax=Actinoplanes sp. NPDC020271 TaxID=3363896 RepID=UPI0037BC572B